LNPPAVFIKVSQIAKWIVTEFVVTSFHTASKASAGRQGFSNLRLRESLAINPKSALLIATSFLSML